MTTPNQNTEEQNATIEIAPLELMERAQIDMQISTAKKYPRSIGRFKSSLISMATLDDETAESCIYSLPRGGKTLQGASVRLMEMAASAWGNLRVGTRIVGGNDKTVTAQAICHDLETNTCVTIEKQRRITDKNGNKFNDDMQIVTANAAASIAFRDVISRVIPKAYIQPAYEAAKKLALGERGSMTLTVRRASAIDFFKKMGLTQERILSAVGKERLDDIDIEDLEKLTGFKNAIKNNEATVDECFPKFTPAKPDFKEEKKEKLPEPTAPTESKESK